MYKKIAFLLLITTLLASCGVGRNTVSSKKNASIQDELIAYGRGYLGKPYRYAGKGPNAFDCSGYTAFVFKKFGYQLNASSSGQDRQVPSIDRKQDLTKGDLVFFEGRTRNGRVGHVGIVTHVKPNGEFDFIHASTVSGVIISQSTEPYYAARYLRGGRVIEDGAFPKDAEEEPIIIVQTDSTKTPRLTERKIDGNHETETDTGKEANDHTPTPKPQPMIRQENISVPKPSKKATPL